MDRRRALKLYIVAIGCLGAAAVILSGFYAAHMMRAELLDDVPVSLLLIAVGWLGSRKQVVLGESNSFGMGGITQIATLLILPFPLALLAILIAKALGEASLWIMRQHFRTLRAAVVNTGGAVLANAAAGGSFLLLQGHQHLWDRGISSLLALPALCALACTYHIIDVLVVVGAISLHKQESPWAVFRSTNRGTLLPEMSLIFVGMVFGIFWHYAPLLSLLVAVPVVISIRSFENLARLRHETIEAVLRMAESIDYRDTGTYEHSKRLADLTRRLAQSLGLTPEHVDEIVLASRVHDLGKIGISDDILLKPDSLTHTERKTMQNHPVIGANILNSFSAFQGSVGIVKHHHERWDGAGYPAGLKGVEIPLGSRIIAVVDAFDSMTASRPYHKGIDVGVAVERLKTGMGGQFDPRVCGEFINLLIEEGSYTPSDTAPALHIVPRHDVAG